MKIEDVNHNIAMFRRFPPKNSEGEMFKCDVVGDRISQPYDSQKSFHFAARAISKYGGKLMGRKTTSDKITAVCRETFREAVSHLEECGGFQEVQEALKRIQTLESSYAQTKDTVPEHKKIYTELCSIRMASEIELQPDIIYMSRLLEKYLTPLVEGSASDNDRLALTQMVSILKEDHELADLKSLVPLLKPKVIPVFAKLYGSEAFQKDLWDALLRDQIGAIKIDEIVRATEAEKAAAKLTELLKRKRFRNYATQALDQIEAQSKPRLQEIITFLLPPAFEHLVSQYGTETFIDKFFDLATPSQQAVLYSKRLAALKNSSSIAENLQKLRADKTISNSLMHQVIRRLTEEVGPKDMALIFQDLNAEDFQSLVDIFGIREFIDRVFAHVGKEEKPSLIKNMPHFEARLIRLTMAAKHAVQESKSGHEMIDKLKVETERFNISLWEQNYFIENVLLQLFAGEKSGLSVPIVKTLLDSIGKENIESILLLLHDDSEEPVVEWVVNQYGRNQFVDAIFSRFNQNAKAALKERIPSLMKNEKIILQTAKETAKAPSPEASAEFMTRTIKERELCALESKFLLTQILERAGHKQTGQIFSRLSPSELKEAIKLLPSMEMGKILRECGEKERQIILNSLST